MRLFEAFSAFPERNSSPWEVFSRSEQQPGPSTAKDLVANIVFCTLALALFYLLSRPAFK